MFSLFVPAHYSLKRTSALSFVLILVAFLCCQNATALTEDAAPIKIKYNRGGTSSWYPYGYMGNSQKPGVFAEIVAEIDRLTPYQFEASHFPTKRALKLLDEDLLDFDFISPEWIPEQELAQDFVLTDSVLSLKEYIITLPQNAHLFQRPEDILGKKIGTIAGYSYHDDDQFERVDFLNEEQLIRGLELGRFNAIILEQRVAQYWAKMHQIDITITTLHSHGDIMIRLRKELDWLLPELNQAISTIKTSGTLERIFAKYDI